MRARSIFLAVVTRFADFHVAASFSPTRSMLLTGVDKRLNGMGNLREAMPRVAAGILLSICAAVFCNRKRTATK